MNINNEKLGKGRRKKITRTDVGGGHLASINGVSTQNRIHKPLQNDLGAGGVEGTTSIQGIQYFR